MLVLLFVVVGVKTNKNINKLMSDEMIIKYQ